MVTTVCDTISVDSFKFRYLIKRP